MLKQLLYKIKERINEYNFRKFHNLPKDSKITLKLVVDSNEAYMKHRYRNENKGNGCAEIGLEKTLS